MSEPSYFDDPHAANALHREALSWIGTPFRQLIGVSPWDLENLKGKGGAVDCIGLASEIFFRIGATRRWHFPREAADYQAANALGDKVLDWLRGKEDDPQSQELMEILVELKIPDAVTDLHAGCPRDFFKPGDVLVMRHGALFHMPVIYDDDLHFVNAVPRLGVVEGTIQDSSYSSHLVAVFRLKPKSKISVDLTPDWEREGR